MHVSRSTKLQYFYVSFLDFHWHLGLLNFSNRLVCSLKLEHVYNQINQIYEEVMHNFIAFSKIMEVISNIMIEKFMIWSEWKVNILYWTMFVFKNWGEIALNLNSKNYWNWTQVRTGQQVFWVCRASFAHHVVFVSEFIRLLLLLY